MNKKISNSRHPMKNFRPLEKRSKSGADETAPVSTLENIATNAHKNTPNCKLYNSDCHEISYCIEYPNLESRKVMCRELNLCILSFSERRKLKTAEEFLSYPFNVTNVKLTNMSLPFVKAKQRKLRYLFDYIHQFGITRAYSQCYDNQRKSDV